MAFYNTIQYSLFRHLYSKFKNHKTSLGLGLDSRPKPKLNLRDQDHQIGSISIFVCSVAINISYHTRNVNYRLTFLSINIEDIHFEIVCILV